MVVVDEGTRVEDIGGTACEDGYVRSEDIVDGAAEDAEDSEGRVKGSERVVGDSGVDLTTTSHSRERIEHAGTAEADQTNEDDLDKWRIVP